MSTQNRLEELKRRRKALRLVHEDIASWIDKGRATYTRKEKGEIPITMEEWDTIEAKLSEMEMAKSFKKEVVPGCILMEIDADKKICSSIARVYKSGQKDIILAFETGMKVIVSMLDREDQMGEILNKLNTLIFDNNEFHYRLDKNDGRVESIEAKVTEILELESPGEKTVAPEITEVDTAAVKSTNSSEN
jgi:hypothetical protein